MQMNCMKLGRHWSSLCICSAILRACTEWKCFIFFYFLHNHLRKLKKHTHTHTHIQSVLHVTLCPLHVHVTGMPRCRGAENLFVTLCVCVCVCVCVVKVSKDQSQVPIAPSHAKQNQLGYQGHITSTQAQNSLFWQTQNTVMAVKLSEVLTEFCESLVVKDAVKCRNDIFYNISLYYKKKFFCFLIIKLKDAVLYLEDFCAKQCPHMRR